MKTINREAIKRMTESGGSATTGGGGSQIVSLTGYAQQLWVEQNYISKAFFSRIFGVFDANGDAIDPNDTETAIDTVAMPSNVEVGGDMAVDDNMEVGGTTKMTGHVGIGTNPHSTYALNANGEVLVQTGVLSNGYVTALSDIRKKNVIEDIELDVNAIALARLIRFTWKDRKSDIGKHVGGIAQEWQKILPEAVHESADGTLSMDYGTIGMMAAVTLARKVVEQERRLEVLEARIKRLEKIL